MIIEQPQVSQTAKLSAKQAAEVLQVSKRSILNYITSGRLRATIATRKVKEKDGSTKTVYGKYRITGRDLIRFWNQF